MSKYKNFNIHVIHIDYSFLKFMGYSFDNNRYMAAHTPDDIEKMLEDDEEKDD